MFDWDDGNVDHIAHHNVLPEEAEEALLDQHRFGIAVHVVEHERRWGVVGATSAGRILAIVFTRRVGRIRVVTARPATLPENRRYRSRRRR